MKVKFNKVESFTINSQSTNYIILYADRVNVGFAGQDQDLEILFDDHEKAQKFYKSIAYKLANNPKKDKTGQKKKVQEEGGKK